MNASNALLPADQFLNADRWGQMEKLAQTLVQSKALPRDIQNAPQAMVKLQAGLEMGLTPMQALTGLTIINGVANPWGKTVTFLLRQKGWRIAYEEADDQCTAIVKKDDEEYQETLTFQQAEQSKFTTQLRKDRDGNYAKDAHGQYIKDLKAGWYPGVNRKLKLRYGALSMIIKSYIPEVLGGAADIAEVAEDYVIEEITPASEVDNVPAKPKTEEVITTTPDERKAGLAEFIEKEKNKPKTTDLSKMTKKDIKKAPKHVQIIDKNEEMPKATGQTVKEMQSSDVKPQAEEGEIIADNATKEN